MEEQDQATDHIVSPFVADVECCSSSAAASARCSKTGNGESLRGAKRISNGGDYFASPVAGDGKIYVASDNGKVVVLKNDADYEVLATNDVGDAVVATPAIADGLIFIRTRSKLLAVGASETPEKKPE